MLCLAGKQFVNHLVEYFHVAQALSLTFAFCLRRSRLPSKLTSTPTTIGNYLVEERIGSGGMGVVYRGRHVKLPREVAIKSINQRAVDRDLRRLHDRFEREAFIQSQLDHPGIVKIYDYIVAEQTYYIVMEYVEGRSLAQLLAGEDGALGVERAVNLFEQLLTAVSYAHNFTYQDQNGESHRGIIHRDLKPHNILVTTDDRVKVTDFGIVKLVGTTHSDALSIAYGSPRYVSPEQAEGRPVDQRSDIYSLGVILYEMLTGAPPFGGGGEKLTRTEILRAHLEREPRPPSELNEDVTFQVEAAVLCALAKDPARRFRTAADFLRAIRHAQNGEESELEPPLLSDELPVVPPAPADSLGRRTSSGQHLREDASEDLTSRQSYVTQPMGLAKCRMCGAEAESEGEPCRNCGAHSSASSATDRLVRQTSLPPLHRAPVPRSAIGILGALALCAGLFFVIRSLLPTAPVVPVATETPAAAPPSVSTGQSAPVELVPSRVMVDSRYEGYSERPLTDGIVDVRRIAEMRYNEGNWASAETPDAHWIELQLERPALLTAVYVYWGFDRNRYTPSRRVELQAPDENGAWRTIATIKPGDDYDRTAFEFTPLTLSRLRIMQPAQQGPQNRPFVMWVREVKIFGAPMP